MIHLKEDRGKLPKWAQQTLENLEVDRAEWRSRAQSALT